MLAERRQLESLGNAIDGALSSEHVDLVRELQQFADSASGNDLHLFMTALKRCLELDGRS